MFDEDRLGNYGTDAAGTRESDDGREEMDEKDRKVAHFSIVAALKTREIPGTFAIRHAQVEYCSRVKFSESLVRSERGTCA